MHIEIDTAHLSRDITTMHDRVEELGQAKTNVFNCLEGLNGMWVGAAHDAFVIQTGVDGEMLDSLIQNINHLISCMEYAKGEYEKCQEDVNSTISAMHLSNDT